MAVVVWCVARIAIAGAAFMLASTLSLRAQDAASYTNSAAASAIAPSAPDTFDKLFLPASAAATIAGGLGYEIGMRWRFLGSTEEQAKRREALLLGLIGGTVASGIATLVVADDADGIVTRKAFTGALTGVVPAAALAAAATIPVPEWLQKPVGALVYGVVQGGVTAWMAGK